MKFEVMKEVVKAAPLLPLLQTVEATERRAVCAEAATWVGTPYHDGANKKGAGIDCAMILIEVYAKCGVIKWRDPRPYPPDYYIHNDSPRYFDELAKHGRLTDAAQIGDICLFNFGRAPAHSGIIVNLDALTIIHAYKGRRCGYDEVERADWLRERLVGIFTWWPHEKIED